MALVIAEINVIVEPKFEKLLRLRMQRHIRKILQFIGYRMIH